MKILKEGTNPEWTGKEINCNCGFKGILEKNDNVEIKLIAIKYDEYEEFGYLGKYYRIKKYITTSCPSCRKKIIISIKDLASGLSRTSADKFILEHE